MSYKKGVVESVSLKEEREGQYGKFAGYGLKVDNEWFNGIANTVKSLGRVAVVDKDYNEVKEGMSVEFMFDTNDKGYHNIDKKTFKILASGSASQPPQSNNAPQTAINTNEPQKSSETAKNSPTDAIIRSNCLVAATIKAHGSLDSEKFRALEDDMIYRAADRHMDYCKNGRK